MDGRRLALLVAVDDYEDPGLSRLRAPSSDAAALADVLGDPELGEFEVEVVRNETNSVISRRVDSLFASARPNDLIVLHFSCHGLKDDSGELYLAATNTEPTLLPSTAVDAALVNRLMRKSRAQRVILFLDCCYGGAFERGVVARAAGTVDVADQFQQGQQELGGGRGRVVITASNAMEFAFEGTELADAEASQPSIFTSAVVDGIRSGRADRDQDGLVSLGELYDYVYDRVREVSPNQTPGKWEFGLQGDLILAKNPQRLVVPAPVPADLLELLEHPRTGIRLAAVHELGRLAEGTKLSVAAGAREQLERLVHDDSMILRSAVEEALERTRVRVSEERVDLGRVAAGTHVVARVSIEGAPLAVASKVESSTPRLRARRVERAIRIEADTSEAGPIAGTVTVAGPAGTAEVHVVGVVEVVEGDHNRVAAQEAERQRQADLERRERERAATVDDKRAAAAQQVDVAERERQPDPERREPAPVGRVETATTATAETHAHQSAQRAEPREFQPLFRALAAAEAERQPKAVTAEPIADTSSENRRRVLAGLIDFGILGAIAWVVQQLTTSTLGSAYSFGIGTLRFPSALSQLVAVVMVLVVTAGYFIYMWTRLSGATVGMKLCNLRVRDATNQGPITRHQAIKRWLLIGAPYALIVLGTLGPFILLVWYAFLLGTIARRPTRMGLHDRYAMTVVTTGK